MPGIGEVAIIPKIIEITAFHTEQLHQLFVGVDAALVWSAIAGGASFLRFLKHMEDPFEHVLRCGDCVT